MKNLLSIIILFTTLPGLAQDIRVGDSPNTDTLTQRQTLDSLALVKKADSLSNQLAALEQNLKLDPLDTLIDPSLSKVDSIQQKIAEVTNLQVAGPLKDSLGLTHVESQVREVKNKADSIQQKMNDLSSGAWIGSMTDSLGMERWKNKLPGDSLRNRLASFKDSISQKLDPKIKAATLEKKLDSAQLRIMDTVNTRIERKLSGFKAKQDSLGSFADKPQEIITGTQNKLEEKMEDVSALPEQRLEGLGTANPLDKVNKVDVPELGGVDLPLNVPDLQNPVDIALPTQKILPDNLEGIDMGDLNDLTGELDLPQTELPSLEKGLEDIKPDVNLNQEIEGLTDVDIKNSIADPLQEVKGSIEKPVEDLKNIEGVQGVKGKVGDVKGQVSEISAEAGGWNKDINAAREGDSQALEQRISEQVDVGEELNYLQQQKGTLEGYQLSYEEKLRIMRELQDEEVLRNKLEEKLKEEAPNYFAGHQDKILAAQQSLLAYKQKYSEVSSVRDLSTGKARVTRKNRFFDRLMLGTDLEFVRFDDSFLDVAPYLAYELTKRWHLKVGHAWRFYITTADGLDMNSNGTRGLRTSLNFHIAKGFIVLAGYERSRLNLRPNGAVAETTATTGLGVAGIRKRYKIFRSFYGDGQVLYNHPFSGDSPYKNRINLRLGFFLDFRSKNKKRQSP